MDTEENKKNSTGKIMVSICAVAYNHGKYIRQALDSFLNQKTDFPFEIIIHDDASTDDTAAIIEEYTKRFPHIIKPVLETENQYSRGITNLSGAFNFPRACGRYITLCDCDDYYSDPFKLKKQVDYMESNKDCSICFHSAKVITLEGAFIDKNLMRPYRHDRDLTSDELIDSKRGFPFASIMIRAEYLNKLPDFYKNCPVGDIPLFLIAATHGRGHYIDEPMSVYRFNIKGSWTERMKDEDYEKKQRAYAGGMKKTYESFDEETGRKFHASALSAFRRIFFLTQVNTRNWDIIFDKRFKKYYRELPLRERFFARFEKTAPSLYAGIRKAYRNRKQ